MKYLAFLMAFMLIGIAPARAEIETYGFDKDHTQIIFGVNHMGYTTSRGKFMDFDGSIEFNRSEPAKSKVDVTIQTNSIEMGTDLWNEHVMAANLLDATTYPTMTFKSTDIEVTGDTSAKIKGDLTLHGITKPVVLDVIFNNASKAPMGEDYKAGFSATANLKRSDFGIDYGIPMVGDEVDIMIEVEAIRTSGDVVNP